MASKQVTLIIKHDLIQQRRQIDLQIAYFVKMKHTRAEGDPNIQAQIDRCMEPLAQASANIEAAITDLELRLR